MRLVWQMYEGLAELEGHYDSGYSELLGYVEAFRNGWTAFVVEPDSDSEDIGDFPDLIAALQAVEAAVSGPEAL